MFTYHQVRTLKSSTFCPHFTLTCFVLILAQTATVSLHSISWVGFITDGVCLLLLLVVAVVVVVLLAAIELSLGGSGPYTSTDKTNKNKCT